MIETLEDLGGQALEPGQSFNFQCRPDLECFGSCCRNKRLPLWPYDMLRLRRGLKKPSDAILAEFVELETDPRSGWPALRLKLKDDGSCPFVGAGGGCTVYEHRPACCRIYPLARAVAPPRGGKPASEIFIIQDAPGCLGLNQANPMDSARWSADQGLGPYQKANNRLLRLLMHPRRVGAVSLNPAQTHAFIAALYNLEVFRSQVRQPSFAKQYDINKKALKKALKTDEALLEFSQDWLTRMLFG